MTFMAESFQNSWDNLNFFNYFSEMENVLKEHSCKKY